MSDSSEIDAALVAKLLGDATLASLLPDGVFFDIANEGAKRYVIVSLLDATDAPMLGGRAYEIPTYLVKAVGFSTVITGATIKAAAARIDALLEGQPITAAGYTISGLQRTERIRYTEVDPDDASLRWFHRGGHYELTASPS